MSVFNQAVEAPDKCITLLGIKKHIYIFVQCFSFCFCFCLFVCFFVFVFLFLFCFVVVFVAVCLFFCFLKVKAMEKVVARFVPNRSHLC